MVVRPDITEHEPIEFTVVLRGAIFTQCWLRGTVVERRSL